MKDVTKRSERKPGRAAVITVKVLEALGETIFNLFEFAGAVLEAGYGAPGSRIEYLYEKNRYKGGRSNDREDREAEITASHKKLLYRLRRDNLVEEVKDRKGSEKFIVTAKGKRYAALMRQQQAKQMILRSYPWEKSDEFIIVAFDVPEKDRRKRRWLWAALNRMKFSKIQQSVWIGQVKIPSAFLEDLKKYNLVDQVEFFKAVRLGSLSAERH